MPLAANALASSLSRIDRWIAATLPNDPAVTRWRARTGLTQADAGPLVAAVSAAGLRDDLISGPERVIALFGPPSFTRRNRLVYDLALWPAHQFVWAISEWGDVAALGMRLRDPAALLPISVRGVEGARAMFRLWHHTEHEVRLVWGKPDHVDGHPQRAWHWSYDVPQRADRVRLGFMPPTVQRLRFGFAWGLLYELVAESRPSALHRAVR
jgi:hypothetical protein